MGFGNPEFWDYFIACFENIMRIAADRRALNKIDRDWLPLSGRV